MFSVKRDFQVNRKIEENRGGKKQKMINDVPKKVRRDFEKEGFQDSLNEFPPELIVFLKRDCKNYLKALQKPFSRDKREAILVHFSKDKRLAKMAIKSLIHLDLAKKYFPKHQAYLRLLTLDLIKLRAERGDVSTLEEVALKMLKRTEQEKVLKGADEDTIELLVTWLRVKGANAVYQDPSCFFKVFNYTKERREIFSRALAYVYPKMVRDKALSLPFLKILEGRVMG